MADTFVLIHGAWHGAWCWRAVMSELERRGHRALALDLPGHCDNQRDHALVNLTAYVDYVADTIKARDLRDVVLVGHSLGGLTVAGVAESVPNRIKRVVFASAMVMLNGERPVAELERVAPNRPASRGEKTGPYSVMINYDDFTRYFIQDASADLAKFVYHALVPQPTRVLTEPIPYRGFAALDLPTGFIACENDLAMGDPAVWHPGFSSRLRNPVIRSLKCGHELIFTHPVETAHALIEIATA
jgi:pimeloyl-ACP methyl ester carboxylesterase